MPSDGEFNSEVHLIKNDITVDSLVAPRVLQVHIKRSKTGLFRRFSFLNFLTMMLPL